MGASPRTSPVADGPPADGADGEAMLVAAAQRHAHAFAPLYETYFDAVYRYCYHRLGSWEAAEDAASLVFVNALAALPRYRPAGRGDSFRAWLFAIAHNVVANQHRHRARHSDRPLAAASGLAGGEPSPEESALADEAHQTVRALLIRLPDDQRRLLELRLAGLTDAEIARVLGRTRGAVRVAQHRAVVRLRSLLGIALRPKEAPDA